MLRIALTLLAYFAFGYLVGSVVGILLQLILTLGR